MSRIFAVNGTKININNYVGPDGEQFPGTCILGRPDKMEEYGITEVFPAPAPVDFSPETYNTREIDTAPYIVYERKSEQELKDNRNAAIDSQISDLEYAALRVGLLRTVMEDMQTRFLEKAASLGITEAELLSPDSPTFSKPYEKLWKNIEARRILREQRL